MIETPYRLDTVSFLLAGGFPGISFIPVFCKAQGEAAPLIIAGSRPLTGLAAAFGISSGAPKWNVVGGDATCISPVCKQVASEILEDLHPDYKNVDPCDDFYQMVCGGFEEKHMADHGYVNQRKTFQSFTIFRELTSCGSGSYGGGSAQHAS